MASKKGGIYHLQETTHSPHGISATVMGAVSLIIFGVLTVVSIFGTEEIGYWAGAVGVTAFVIAFFGMLIGFKSFTDSCKSYLLSKIGTLLCGLMVAVWFLICCIGLANL